MMFCDDEDIYNFDIIVSQKADFLNSNIEVARMSTKDLQWVNERISGKKIIFYLSNN